MRFALGRRAAAVLIVAGAATAPLAALGLAATAEAGRRAAPAEPVAPVAAAAPAADLMDGLGVSAQRRTYRPGESSGWHSHAGIHSVIVTSGTLTVYDAGCRSRTYGVDEPYLGGREDHLVRNETDEPVEMTVMYVGPPQAARHGEHTRFQPPPDGCPA